MAKRTKKISPSSDSLILEIERKKAKEKEKKKTKGPRYTSPLKPIQETKFCKDCKDYNKPICQGKQKVTSRKETCTNWKMKKL